MELISHFLHLRAVGTVRVSVPTDSKVTVAAFVLGELGDRPLVRIQSSCAYGEVFGSIDCDCRAQLDASWDLIRDTGSGAVIYLDQEGRGAGLVAKARAYDLLARESLDTFSAYISLGLEADGRTYDDAIELMRHLGIVQLNLLTNNPHKAHACSNAGLDVVRTPLRVPVAPETEHYLDAKRAQGHDL